MLTFQVPHTYAIAVGTPQDEAYVQNFHARLSDGERSYRWTDVYGYVSLPGLGGSRPFTVTIDMDPGRPAPITLFVNGVQFFSKTLQPGWTTVVLRVDNAHSSALASRDTVIEFRAPDYRTNDLLAEPKGVKVSLVRVEQAPSGGFIAPAYRQLALLGLDVLLIYFVTGRGMAGIATMQRSRAWALLAGVVASASLCLALAANHIAISIASMHFVVTLFSVLGLLIIIEGLAFWSISRRIMGLALGRTRARLLALCVALGFGVRYGGMALPQSVIIDMPWHMKWLRTLLTGDWQSLYYPGNLSEVPREWGLAVLIPKSPLFYFAAAPLNLLPFDLETLVKWLICFMDCCVILAVFWLVLRVSGSAGAGMLGSHRVRVHASGLQSLCIRHFANGFRTVARNRCASASRRLCRPPVALDLVGSHNFAGARPRCFPYRGGLSYSRSSVRCWGLVVHSACRTAPSCGLCLAHRAPRHRRVAVSSCRLLWPLYFACYRFCHCVAEGKRWGGFYRSLAWRRARPAGLDRRLRGERATGASCGAGAGATLRGQAHKLQSRSECSGWLPPGWLIAPLFVIANYRIDMIGKHLFFFTMAPVAILGGVALWHISRKGHGPPDWSRSLLGSITWQALTFWVA